jgi:hypothetical protein
MKSEWRKQLFSYQPSKSGVNPLVLPMSKAKAAKILPDIKKLNNLHGDKLWNAQY